MASQNTKPSSKKPKLVRDSFTIPKAEFAAIELLKTRAIGLGTSVKKSELLWNWKVSCFKFKVPRLRNAP